MDDYTSATMGTALIHEIADHEPDRCDVQRCLYLIEKGAQLNYSFNDRTLLEWSVVKGHDEITLAILDKTKDNPHFTQTRSSATLLHLAAFQDRPTIVAELIKRGAALDAQDKDGQTPLHLTALWQRAECARLLLEAGARINVENHDGCHARDYAVIRSCKVIVDMIDDEPRRRKAEAAQKRRAAEKAFNEGIKRGTAVQEKPLLMKPIKLKIPKP